METCPSMCMFFKYPTVYQLTFSFTTELGIKVHTIKFKPINGFQLFLCNEFLKHLVIKANLYAGQFFEQAGNSLGADARALTHEKGLVKKSKVCLYWSVPSGTCHSAFPLFRRMPLPRRVLFFSFLSISLVPALLMKEAEASWAHLQAER